jgi:hypothetical protein
VNLLMVAPLLDSRGTTRYFIGAQVDVSGLCKDCTDLHGLRRMLEKQELAEDPSSADENEEKKDEFQRLSEMLNSSELETVRKHGGGMHRQQVDDSGDSNQKRRHERPRLLLKEPTSPSYGIDVTSSHKSNGKLEGIYQNVSLSFPVFGNLCTNQPQVSLDPSLSFPSYPLFFSGSPCTRHTTIAIYVTYRRLSPSSRRTYSCTSRRPRRNGKSTLGLWTPWRRRRASPLDPLYTTIRSKRFRWRVDGRSR